LTRDADILIVATAITHGLAAASNNDTHFRRIRRLHIKNWLA
jgi:predicted nucleic acid-binding protein